ncbi:molybdenum cofactor guanylyltransferase protein A [Campylobacter pinnipediorum subsp. pinnipediorum]|uniref:molybdenum cofactor guanylyltransferase n=1 Tax=Campylobacter pinnipediorum TaxID=1965231 RepID=UPI000994EB8F|nr:molybdenum cofactor guanylyltransferase [Campylobacter pinnipediorum]AQW83952.1 molybdenum cofactor guanylyltransferase protein A [Campylobacter pinnipediorum subsp. pinnipediorum]AQW84100.1 molybdenum cofactor guanylyltransferase protein A [Campylobacter pinnipediorum subsp. pinnipediorum]
MEHSCKDNGCDGFLLMKQQQSCVVLAGGKSSRMGVDKALMPFKDKASLSAYVTDKLSSIFKEVYISAKNNKFNNAKLNQSIKFIADESDESSPMIALASILHHFNEPVFIQPVDMPFLKPDSIKDMSKLKDDFEIVIACEAERDHVLCGYFSPSVADKARKLAKDGKHKIKELLKICDVVRVELSGDDEGVNLNNPDDLKKALSYE